MKSLTINRIIVLLLAMVLMIILLHAYILKNTETFNNKADYYEPVHIKHLNIYDVLYNSDGELIIISPNLSDKQPKIEFFDDNRKQYIEFDVNRCPHKFTYIYYLKTRRVTNVKLRVDGEEIYTKVNEYPIYNNNEIVFSTLVKNEDNYILQWIAYHKRLGITRFIIYDNSDDSSLVNVLNTHLSSGEVILIRWNHPYVEKKAQQTHQNHSIYAFPNCRYIGFFDIDEYVNIQKKTDLPTFFDELILKNRINTDEISSFRILNRHFYNPDELSTEGTNFLNIFECDDINLNVKQKNFVIPKNTKTFSVHEVTDGKPMYNIPEKYIYFNHYMYLNKPDRGKKRTNITDDSIKIHIQ